MRLHLSEFVFWKQILNYARLEVGNANLTLINGTMGQTTKWMEQFVTLPNVGKSVATSESDVRRFVDCHLDGRTCAAHSVDDGPKREFTTLPKCINISASEMTRHQSRH